MSTIEERAKKFADNYAVGDAAIIVDLMHSVAYDGYVSGAEEQKTIDIDKACEVYADLLSAQGYNPIDVNAEVVRMKKAMEGKRNPLFDSCLAKVDPEIREEVRRNMEE